MTPEQFEQQIMKHEGLKLRPYKDTVGKLTIGVGRNLDDRGISEEEAMYLLHNDVEVHAKELAHHFPIVNELDSVRYYVLVNMCFNLGITRLSKFKKMWAYISSHDYHSAALEMLDSRWAEQVGNRALELSAQMKSGEYHG